MKKLYSLNMIVFLRISGFKELEVGYDAKTQKIFYVFSDEVSKAIDKYKNVETQVNLKDFITKFKELKEEVANHLKLAKR